MVRSKSGTKRMWIKRKKKKKEGGQESQTRDLSFLSCLFSSRFFFLALIEISL